MRILIAEDFDSLRGALWTILHDAGYETIVTNNGADAICRLRENPIDLLILDIGLPGLDGYEVLRQLAGFPAPPKVFILSGSDIDPDRMPTQLVTRVWVKPNLDMQTLLDAVRELPKSGEASCSTEPS